MNSAIAPVGCWQFSAPVPTPPVVPTPVSRGPVSAVPGATVVDDRLVVPGRVPLLVTALALSEVDVLVVPRTTVDLAVVDAEGTAVAPAAAPRSFRPLRREPA